MIKNKKIMILISAVILIALIVSFILIFGGKKELSQQEKLTNKMKEMAENFYQNFYYDQVGSNDVERTTFLKKYETIGFKVNLDNLSRYLDGNSEEILKEFINDKTKQDCDKYQSQAVIYPKEPFAKTSYTIEIQLYCGF